MKRPYGYTDEEIAASVAAHAAWKARVGEQTNRGFLEFMKIYKESVSAFERIEDSIELSKKEREQFISGFEMIVTALEAFSTRVVGYKDGLHEALGDVERTIDEALEADSTVVIRF